MKAIMAAVSLVIAAGFAVLKIRKIAETGASTAEKVGWIRDELAALLKKLDDYAKATDPTWDDKLAAILADAVETVARELIAGLGAA
jgi:hypothetical protein